MQRYAPCIPQSADPGSMCERDDGRYYFAADVDACIAELEQQLAFANDAAAKGETARLAAAGMEARIAELEECLGIKR